MLPPEVEDQHYQQYLATSWKARWDSFGSEPLYSKHIMDKGFSDAVVVLPGWKLPPEQLTNSTRSFFDRTGFEDEAANLIALARIRPDRLQFNPKLYTAYGGAYFLILGVWIGLLSAFTPVVIRPSLSYYLAHIDKMAWLFLAGRLLAAAAYVLSALLTYKIGTRHWGKKAGLWAGLFFAAAPGNIFLTHLMKPGPVGFLGLIGVFFFCAEILDGRSERATWLKAGACLGLAAGATNYLWDGGMLFIVTLWLRARWQKADWRRDFLFSVQAVAAALAIYFLTNLFLIIEYKTAWRSMMRSGEHASRQMIEVWNWALFGFPKVVTPPVAALVLAGLLAKNNRSDPKRFLAMFGFVYYVCLAWMGQGGKQLMSIRHFPATFLACLLAGCLISDWTKPAVSRWKAKLALAAAVAALGYACLMSAVLDFNYHLESVGRSTKEVSGDWIEREIPAGNELGFLRLPQPSNAPYFHWNRYRLSFIEDHVMEADPPFEALPQYLVLTAYDHDPRILLKPLLDKRYVSVKRFEPFSFWGIGHSLGEDLANPLIEIYRRKPA